VRQIDNLRKIVFVGGGEIRNIHAGLRPAQRRHQSDEQHRCATMPRVHVARIANLTKNGKQSLHQSLLESGSLLKNPVLQSPQHLFFYSYAIPLG